MNSPSYGQANDEIKLKYEQRNAGIPLLSVVIFTKYFNYLLLRNLFIVIKIYDKLAK